MTSRRPTPVIASALIGGSLLLSAAARAQSVPNGNALTPPPDLTGGTAQSPAQQITVVGSRLKVSNVTSPSPVTVISRKQIENSSAQTLEDVLRNLPSTGTNGTSRATNNGGQAEECYDLRNLGYQRVLVLIDGHRVVHTGIFGQDCVDLSNIPLALVDQIQILKSGASSIYGADAVSGVVNIILRHDFVGTQFNADGGVAKGGYKQGLISATEGFDFDQGRGNFTVTGEYDNQAPLYQNTRGWANPVVSADPGPGQPYVYGSGIPVGARIFDSPNVLNPLGLDQYAGGGRFPYPAFSDANRYNYANDQFLLAGIQTENVTSTVNEAVNAHVNLYGTIFYTHKDADLQLAPQPVTGGLGANLPPDFIIPAGNPYNPYGEDVALYSRVGEFGNRQTLPAADTYQGTLGLKGQIVGAWNYDVSYSYGKSEDTVRSEGEVNYQRIEQEAGFRQTFDPAATTPADAGVYDPSVCVSPCTLQNFFGGPNSITPQGVAYAGFTEQAVATFFLRDLNAGITNDKLLQLPYGPLGLALGMEHRGEQGSYHPDPLVQSGVTLENAQQPTSGGFNVTEVYGELHVPILAGLRGVKDLSADVAGRYSSYNTFGDAETWQLAGNYSPTRDIRFRAVLGTAFRQPDINELYGGQALSFNTATDPCVGATGTAAANCLGKGINPATFTQNGNGQVQTIIGGNPQLQPETARTYTFGTVLTPRFTPDLAVTVDYWHTKVDHVISSIDTQTILNNCYDSPGLSNSFCNLIAPRNGLGQLTTVTATNQNLGVLRADGLDVGGNYLIRLPNDIDTFSLVTDFSFSFAFQQQNVPDGPFINYNGTNDFTNNPEEAFPRVRNTSAVTWNHRKFSLTYRMRYIDGMKYFPAGGTFGPGVSRDFQNNEVFYHDIEANYTYRNIAVAFGVDNLLDKQPPFDPDGTSNTNYQIYDVLGRLFYLRTQVKF